jgi:hypothetical protein
MTQRMTQRKNPNDVLKKLLAGRLNAQRKGQGKGETAGPPAKA